jgi:hypothetical protein
MTNGTLDAFTTANVTLAGNAILTVTDVVFANSFRALETHYVSANANGTYSIMLKTAFRSYITVVDGKARVGFFKDGSASYTIKAATNLETPEWDVIQSEEATDAADVSELPLYWVKTTEGEKEYRFFKLSVE